MAEKVGAGGKPQQYDKTTGQYGSGEIKSVDSGIRKQEESKRKELEKKYNDDLPLKSKEGLSKQEWALWYKAVAENKVLGYWAEELDDGNAILKIENNNSHKIVITGGTFENPKANAVYSFSSADEMNDYIGVLKSYDEK